MIKYHGTVTISTETTEYADKIKLENYKTNTPAKFQVRCLTGCDWLMKQLSGVVDVPKERLDFVYFSCCQGAEPHTDKLNPKKFEDITFVIPVILPQGKSIIMAGDQKVEAKLGGVYEFDHTKIHAMFLKDNESGCVVIMVGVLKQEWINARVVQA